MPTKQTGYIVVEEKWAKTSPISRILGTATTDATGNGYLFIAASFGVDPLGIWLKDITTDAIVDKDSGAPTKLDFLVPWGYVLGYGVSDEGGAKKTVGFQAANATATQP
jgi:hypothetical protein